jgi:hypothetical protein
MTTAELVKHGQNGARAFGDGYPITAHQLTPGTNPFFAWENGWKRARDKAIAEGLALPGADNASHPGSR